MAQIEVCFDSRCQGCRGNPRSEIQKKYRRQNQNRTDRVAEGMDGIVFTTAMFGKSKIRLRPSYFPFTEPSAEVDVYWGLETETDYRMTKGTGWLEIMGCGMVNPQVLDNCGIDSSEYTGFAFGMGIDRVALLLHQIPDIRMLSENDIPEFVELF